MVLDDRERSGLPANSGALTDSALLRDFIFAVNGAVGTGLDVKVSGLTANATYLVELWSFDAGSITMSRTSDWTVNGATLWNDVICGFQRRIYTISPGMAILDWL